MSFLDFCEKVTIREADRKKENAKKTLKQSSLRNLRVRIYDSDDPNEGWYYPKNTSPMEMEKCKIIKENYYQAKVNMEPDPVKRALKQKMLDRGIYDFEGL